jgi:hypothetical protein
VQENWEHWEPVFGLSSKYYVESLSDSIEGFRILLSDAYDENKKVEVIFEDSVHAYRSTDESFRRVCQVFCVNSFKRFNACRG